MKTPKDFTDKPTNSILQKSETETIARNIMVILERTGNTFRPISWGEYKEERRKDGNFTESELKYFNAVSPYCQSQKIAELFSPAWK